MIFAGAKKSHGLLHGDLEDLPAAVDATAISGPRKRWVFSEDSKYLCGFNLTVHVLPRKLTWYRTITSFSRRYIDSFMAVYQLSC